MLSSNQSQPHDCTEEKSGNNFIPLCTPRSCFCPSILSPKPQRPALCISPSLLSPLVNSPFKFADFGKYFCYIFQIESQRPKKSSRIKLLIKHLIEVHYYLALVHTKLLQR